MNTGTLDEIPEGGRNINIQILEVDFSKQKILQSIGSKAYWIKYRHALIEGFCYFVPSSGREIEVMKKYSVETSQEKVLSVRKIYKDHLITYKSQIDTYEVIGEVSFISKDKEIMFLSIRDIEFCIDKDEIDISEINIKDNVEIEIKELILWDVGIY
ncbi:hypothetical protein [Saccharibacillus sacchari]|uniref:hypothetical protein n=1 Tax=Saccharibacillus sacchari TaxID=456493 RepID=UPI0012EC854E|nr:hypothetical protein [Saccharibacillus sacchari]